MRTSKSKVTPLCRHPKGHENRPLQACAYCAASNAGVPTHALKEVLWSLHEQLRRPYSGRGCDACDKPDEPYMLHDDLWSAVAHSSHENFLCLSCVESRLGRPLAIGDFTGAMLSYGFMPGFDIRTYLEKKSAVA